MVLLVNKQTGEPELRPIVASGFLDDADEAPGGANADHLTGAEPVAAHLPGPIAAVSILPPDVVAAAETIAAFEHHLAQAEKTPTEAHQEVPAAVPHVHSPEPAPTLAAPATGPVVAVPIIEPRGVIATVLRPRGIGSEMVLPPEPDRIALARAALVAAGLPTDVIDGKPPVANGLGTGTVKAAAATWNGTKWAAGLVTSVRTLLFFGVTIAVGLLDSLQTIDITGLLSHFTGAKITTGDIMALMGIAGVLLRLVTKGPAFARWSKAAHGGGGSDSLVDDPM